MRYFLDTEFYETPGKLSLISLALVAEDGRELYLGHLEADWLSVVYDEWLSMNVLPHLPLDGLSLTEKDFGLDRAFWKTREELAQAVLDFIGDDRAPKFWGYYADYDWVASCQIFGRMVDLPKRFPMFCRDLKQWAITLEECKDDLPAQHADRHDALGDARWNRDLFDHLHAVANDSERFGRYSYHLCSICTEDDIL